MARVRKQAGTREALLQYSPTVVLDPHLYQGQWSSYFGNDQPIHVEIGMGRGRFISAMSQLHPEINYIGVEMVEEILLYAVEKMTKHDGIPENLVMIWINAQEIETLFAPNEIERIYLNFSDPWPKYKHRKRRLTHHNFLEQYAIILSPTGEVHLKTDNQGLFEFSLNEFSSCDWKLKNIQLDLYQKLPTENIATEYEMKFTKQDLPIYRFEAQKRA